MRLLPALTVLVLLACGPALPGRHVLEQDLGAYKYRRYQKALDVEIGVDGNPATAYHATYLRSGTPMRIAPVSVTIYTHAAGLSDSVRTTLRDMQGYRYGVDKREGNYVWTLQGEDGDRWVLWTSGPALLKLGTPEGQPDVPQDVLEGYLEEYPSNLDSKGYPQPE